MYLCSEIFCRALYATDGLGTEIPSERKQSPIIGCLLSGKMTELVSTGPDLKTSTQYLTRIFYKRVKIAQTILQPRVSIGKGARMGSNYPQNVLSKTHLSPFYLFFDKLIVAFRGNFSFQCQGLLLI